MAMAEALSLPLLIQFSLLLVSHAKQMTCCTKMLFALC